MLPRQFLCNQLPQKCNSSMYTDGLYLNTEIETETEDQAIYYYGRIAVLNYKGHVIYCYLQIT
jgi:hypothetical protein